MSGRFGDTIVLSPLSSGDDAAYVKAVLAANPGRAILLGAGGLSSAVYNWQTPCDVPSGSEIFSQANVAINSSIANDANPNSAVFRALQTTILAGNPNATINAGSFSFGSVISFNIGDTLIFESNNFHFDYVKILAKSGAGPFSYNVDKPFSNSYTAADTVASITPPEKIKIDLGGAVIQGTGTRFFEFVLARRCVIKNVNLKPTANMDLLASFDTGSVECGFVNCNVFVPAGITILGGLALETNERSYLKNCYIFGSNTSTTSQGIALYDCVNCDVDACSAYGCVNGLSLGADSDTIGCLDCTIRAGIYNGNATGVALTGGSSRNTIIGVTTQYNGYGVAISSDASTCSQNALIGGKSTGNFIGGTNTGIYLFAGAKNTRIDSYDVSGNGHSTTTGNGIITNEDVLITNLITKSGSTGNGLTGSGNGGGLIVFQSSCVVTLDGFDLVSDPGTAINCLVVPAGSTFIASNGTLRIGHSCNGINQSAIARLNKVIIKPAVSSSGELGIVVTAGATRRSNDCDFTACSTPIYDNTTGAAYTGATNALCNFGQTTANNATNVDVNFADTHPNEMPTFALKTAAGTPSATALTMVSWTANSKFTWHANNLDTSAYYWSL